ncbi:polyribonucleotide nucleotidyltransferase 1, mitochondrial [Aplysia californica]|uniref:polyribonucleotide nucleotidyltransferase n=1 Tax=Aplysia californica TaxID=6500 RepID=A0ABM0JT34_APLCA|nr:polyribonucleotide nucleotidyltransferase 1, mitochondrial [Aplysia californica]
MVCFVALCSPVSLAVSIFKSSTNTMAAPIIRVFSCRVRKGFKHVWLRPHRLKHSNPWRDIKCNPQLVIACGNDTMRFSSGKMARFADGAAVVQLGETSVLVTAVSQRQSGTQSFLPLTVDFRQKAAAAGRIPTNHLRRELGPSAKEILTSRVIDRSLRPLFPAGFYYNTQVMCNLLAVDGANDPDIISINAASAALAVSDIPWNGPVAAVRVGVVDDEVVINPTRRQLQKSSLNIILTGTSENKVVMLEGEADRVPLHKVEQALSQAVKATQSIIKTIRELQEAVGKPKRALDPLKVFPQHIENAVQSFSHNHIRDILFNDEHNKISRDQALRAIGEQVVLNVKESFPEVEESVVLSSYQTYVKQVFRNLILDESRRCDGRSLTEMRDISCEVDLYQPLHGSALFQRGQTQVLCTVTFDSLASALKSDPLSVTTGSSTEKKFMLHYEFPPYATNETGRGGIGRRELGHGALAEKGLKPILPDESDFTVRLTSEVLESNGSSSMASVCGGSLALMDAGVQVKEPAAGVAMGLVTRTDPETGKISHHQILTDLLGIEDYMGDMDFKMAATARGMTAIQADIKLPGIPFFIVIKALEGGFAATKQIMEIMSQTISSPRKSLKTCGPVTEKLVLDHSKQSRLVGFGGYNLRKLKSETGVTVTRIDEGSFQVFAPNADAMAEAKELMEKFMEDQREPDLEFGAIYTGRIVEIREFGVMVELHPKLKPVLLHNSQLDQRKVSHASSLGMEVGNEISVKYFGRDPSTGTHRISRKVLQSPGVPLIRKLNPKL